MCRLLGISAKLLLLLASDGVCVVAGAVTEEGLPVSGISTVLLSTGVEIQWIKLFVPTSPALLRCK